MFSKNKVFFIIICISFSCFFYSCSNFIEEVKEDKQKQENESNSSSMILVKGATVNTSVGNAAFKNASENPVEINDFWIFQDLISVGLFTQVYNWALNNGYVFENSSKISAMQDKLSDNSQYIFFFTDLRTAVVWCNAFSEYTNLTPVYYEDPNYTTVLRTAEIFSSSYSSSFTSSDIGKVEKSYLKPNATGYRLPFDAEWEFASRGGDQTAAAWNNNYSGTENDSSSPNSLGLYHMTTGIQQPCFNINNNLYLDKNDTGFNGSIKKVFGSYSTTYEGYDIRGSANNTRLVCVPEMYFKYADYDDLDETSAALRLVKSANNSNNISLLCKDVSNFIAYGMDCNTVELSWKKLSNISNITISRSTEKDGTYASISYSSDGKNYYLDSGLSANTLYWYKIEYGVGENSVTEYSFATTQAASPTDFIMEYSSSKAVTIKCNKNDLLDNGYLYYIDCFTDENCTSANYVDSGSFFKIKDNKIDSTDDTCELTISGLINPKTTYYFKVKSKCWRSDTGDTGYGNYSAVFSGTTKIDSVLVEGGTFTSGGKTVTVSSFYINPYETTWQDRYKILKDEEINFLSVNEFYASPITFSWYEALVYCNKLSKKENLTPCYSIKSSTNTDDWGDIPTSNDTDWNAAICDWNANGYRLPTEAEWYFAAIGGKLSKGYTYSGSNSIDDVGWVESNCKYIHAVGIKIANELGLYDMSGNLYELCWDWGGGSFPSGTDNPKGPDTGTWKMCCGGDYDNSARSLTERFSGQWTEQLTSTTTTKIYNYPYKTFATGIRVVRKYQ